MPRSGFTANQRVGAVRVHGCAFECVARMCDAGAGAVAQVAAGADILDINAGVVYNSNPNPNATPNEDTLSPGRYAAGTTNERSPFVNYP